MAKYPSATIKRILVGVKKKHDVSFHFYHDFGCIVHVHEMLWTPWWPAAVAKKYLRILENSPEIEQCDK